MTTIPEIPPMPSNFMAPDSSATLPTANITRLMKSSLPSYAKISSPARDAILACVIEMIGFVTSEANSRANEEKRKTVNGDDLIYAFGNLGFNNYAAVLTVFLARYRETSLSLDPDNSGPRPKGRPRKDKTKKSNSNTASLEHSEEEDFQDEDSEEEGDEEDGQEAETSSVEGSSSSKRGKSAPRARGRGRGRRRGSAVGRGAGARRGEDK